MLLTSPCLHYTLAVLRLAERDHYSPITGAHHSHSTQREALAKLALVIQNLRETVCFVAHCMVLLLQAGG
jgi:hypothetical protein